MIIEYCAEGASGRADGVGGPAGGQRGEQHMYIYIYMHMCIYIYIYIDIDIYTHIHAHKHDHSLGRAPIGAESERRRPGTSGELIVKLLVVPDPSNCFK